MLKSITAALKLSEIREKLNDLNAITEPTDGQKTEETALLASQKTTETEFRAAVTAMRPTNTRRFRSTVKIASTLRSWRAATSAAS